MKKMYLLMVVTITILAVNVNAQVNCQPCQNIAGNIMYNFDNLSNTGPFMTAVKKRLNCTNPQILCSKTVNDSWDYIICTHYYSIGCGNTINYVPYQPFSSACVASMGLGLNNTSTAVNNFAQTLRAAVQRDVDVNFGLGVKQIKCIEITGTQNLSCLNSNGYQLSLKVKFCVDKNENTHD